MNTPGGEGVLHISGVEVRYMTPASLLVQNGLRYIDTFGLLPLFTKLSFDPIQRRWDPPNLLLTGHKGNGKSLLFAYFAQENQIPYLTIDCSEETRERHLKGGFVVKNGSTPFVLGTVANAIHVANEYGQAMLVFEEINALSPQRQKEINPLTDFRKKIEIPELSTRFELLPHAKLFICGTMNPSVYGGTYELNEDLKSRFLEIDVPYPPPASEIRILKEMTPPGVEVSEEALGKLIDIAQQTRQGATGYSLSPRDLVQLLHVIARVGWDDALFMAAQKFSLQDRNLIIDRIRDITRTGVCKDLVERMQVPYAAQQS